MGSRLCRLRRLHKAQWVETAIAEALELRETAQASLSTALRIFLRGKQLLLVLDNFEHVLDAAPLVNQLLSGAPRLKILTTSREPLQIYGERELRVAPSRFRRSIRRRPGTNWKPIRPSSFLLSVRKPSMPSLS